MLISLRKAKSEQSDDAKPRVLVFSRIAGLPKSVTAIMNRSLHLEKRSPSALGWVFLWSIISGPGSCGASINGK